MKVFTQRRRPGSLIQMLLLLGLLSACNAQEFYEKNFLIAEQEAGEETDLDDPRGNIFEPEDDIVSTPSDEENDQSTEGPGQVNTPVAEQDDEEQDNGSGGSGETTNPVAEEDGEGQDDGSNGSGETTNPVAEEDGEGQDDGSGDSGETTNPVAEEDGEEQDDGSNDSGETTNPVAEEDGDEQDDGSGDSGEITNPVAEEDGEEQDDGSNGSGETTNPVAEEDGDEQDDGSGDSGEITNPVADQDDENDPTRDPAEEDDTPAINLVDMSERFTQNVARANKVDILWVVDDSGSMSNDQKRLAQNFEVFIHEFLERDLDFRMGITTTDPTPRGDGKWVGNYKHLTKEAAEANEKKFIRDFKRTINVGTQGSPYETGLHTSLRFLQRYHDRNPDPFVRDDAYLVIIYLSDEEDQSPYSVEEYIKQITAFKKDVAQVKIYSIVMHKNEYHYTGMIGHRYMKAAELVGGINSDIREDFYPILRDMGQSIANLLESFALNGIPYNDQVEVLVDGVKRESGYTYDAQTRSVRFEESAVPREGAVIEIRYQSQTVETA